MATQKQILHATWLFWEDKSPLSPFSSLWQRWMALGSRPGDALQASDCGMQHFQPKAKKQLSQICTSVSKIKTIISQM